MSFNAEPVEIVRAQAFARSQQQKAGATIPSGLQGREARFLERLGKAKVGPLKKLGMLYSLMQALSDAIRPLTPCKKGCSACCHINVVVSELEVAYIDEHTKHRRLRKALPKQDFHGTPCPFLSNGQCSIYSARPFVCRRHHALTPNAYWCEPQRCNDHEFSMIGFTEVDKAFGVILHEAGAGESMDIRQRFRLRRPG